MENIFFLILVGMIGLIRLIMRIAEKQKNAELQKRAAPPANSSATRAPVETDEERVRKFFEALGLPASTQSPTPAPPRRQIIPKNPRTKRPLLPVDPFPIPRAGRIPSPFVVTPEPSTPALSSAPEITPPQTAPAIVIQKPTAPARLERPPAEFEVRDLDEGHLATDPGSLLAPAKAANAAATVITNRRGIIELLATREGLRDAVILREIFGPPRSLQPLSHSITA